MVEFVILNSKITLTLYAFEIRLSFGSKKVVSILCVMCTALTDSPIQIIDKCTNSFGYCYRFFFLL